MTPREKRISEAISLPVDIQLVEWILKSLNPSCKDKNGLRAIEAERRVAEVGM